MSDAPACNVRQSVRRILRLFNFTGLSAYIYNLVVNDIIKYVAGKTASSRDNDIESCVQKGISAIFVRNLVNAIVL